MRYLWDLAFLVRFLAILPALRLAPVEWSAFAVGYSLLSMALHVIVLERFPGYTQAWIFEKIALLMLLAFLVRRTAWPTGLTVAICAGAAALVSAATAIAHLYPTSYVEPVMELSGCVLLAMGLMSMITALARFDWECGILAGYLTCLAVLNLAGNEWLTSPTLGRAFSLLDCIAFAAWGTLWFCKRRGVPEN